jgi:hypothetical protein
MHHNRKHLIPDDADHVFLLYAVEPEERRLRERDFDSTEEYNKFLKSSYSFFKKEGERKTSTETKTEGKSPTPKPFHEGVEDD